MHREDAKSAKGSPKECCSKSKIDLFLAVLGSASTHINLLHKLWLGKG